MNTHKFSLDAPLDGQEQSLTEIYDLVLTFDYENLNTPIGTLAEQLRDRLNAVGLGENHGKLLHIVAHSMGGLVARSFIEQKGGDRVVQHLIMLGTPNGGSPWSTVQDWATTALAIGINSLSTVAFPVKVLGSLVAAIEVIDINLDQMKPGSDFLTALRDCTDPGISYTILAGNTSLIPPPDEATANKLQAFLEKLGRGAIEFPFLGQPNDIAVTVKSIKSVPPERNPRAIMREVACNHLVYFTHPDGLESLAEAVIGTGILTTAIPPSPPASPASSATPDTFSPMSSSSPAPTPNLEASEVSNTTPMPSSGETPVPIRPNTPASEGIPTWLIGLVVALLVVAGGGFWLWQQFKDKEPSHQDNPSQSLIKPSPGSVNHG